METVFKYPTLRRLTAAVYLTLPVCLTCFVSWSLLTPDPFAILRDSSLAWLEQVSDRIIHTAVFTAISFAWFGLFPMLRREIPPITIFALLAYSISMEAFQAFVPGRHCCAPDAICNIAGFVFGLSSVRLLVQMFRPSQAAAALARS